MGSMTGVSNILGSTVTQYHGGCRHHCPRIYNVVHIHITYIYPLSRGPEKIKEHMIFPTNQAVRYITRF